MCQFLSTLLVQSLPTQQISLFSLSFPHFVAVTFFPQQHPVFPHQSGLLNKFASSPFNPHHYFHSLLPPFLCPSFANHSVLSLSSLYLFQQSVLIWRAARPGRFSPWLQLLSQLLSPAGAALCWAPSSIWSSVSVWVCDIRVYMSIDMILSSWYWLAGRHIGVLLFWVSFGQGSVVLQGVSHTKGRLWILQTSLYLWPSGGST